MKKFFLLAALSSFALLSGCAQLNDFNRDYSIEYDATNRQGRFGGRITRAQAPGSGSASLEWGVTARTENLQFEPDFKQPVPVISR
jgi:hypothetical protein